MVDLLDFMDLEIGVGLYGCFEIKEGEQILVSHLSKHSGMSRGE